MATDRGCSFGQATRSMVTWLSAVIGIILLLAITIAGLNASTSAESLKQANTRLREHDSSIGAVEKQGARIEERLKAVQEMLRRMEDQLSQSKARTLSSKESGQ